MDTAILARKIKPIDAQPAPDPAADGLAGVLAKAASVVGLVELDTQLEAKSGASRKAEPVDFIHALPESGLYLRMDGAPNEPFGLLALDSPLFGAIGDVLTGALEPASAEPPRQPTAVDIALCRPYLDALLLEFSEVLLELRGGKPTDIYKTGKLEPEPSAHQFPDVPYIALDIELDMGEGARKGQLSVMIPASQTSFVSAQPRSGETASSWKAAMEERVYKANASLEVVLYRKTMPIGEILRLKTGDILQIPARALENLSVESQKDGARVRLMRARLGEYQEMRAAKVMQIGEEEPSNSSPKLLDSP